MKLTIVINYMLYRTYLLNKLGRVRNLGAKFTDADVKKTLKNGNLNSTRDCFDSDKLQYELHSRYKFGPDSQ